MLRGRIPVEWRRRGRTRPEADVLHLSGTVVPMPGASMRILEVAIASAALVVGILLGLAR